MATKASANFTVLAGLGYENGSLSNQNNQLSLLDTSLVYPGNNDNTDINLTVYPNNIGGISFPVYEESILYALPLAQSILDPSNFRVEIWCAYPLSGQYDILPRGLFYLLLIFSLIFRRHNWLATAALGTAMTYAATSAVHLLALITQFDFGTPDDETGWNLASSKAYGDIDVYGIYPILSAAAIMLTPILNWSVTVRAHEAHMVVVYWGALVFAALVPAWVYWNFISPWWINELPSFAMCPSSAAKEHPDCNPNIFLTTTSYNYCQCVDFCGLLGPATPMRKDANMVAFLSRPIASKNNSGPLINLESFEKFVLGFIVLQGLLGLIESQFTQAEVRNLVFRALYAEPRDFVILLFEGQRQERWLRKFNMQNPSPKTSFRWKIQYQVARFIAASFFVIAIGFAIICPAVFVTSVVTNEFYLTWWPVSEHSDAIGAWSIWVGATMVIIAAVISFWRLIAYATNERKALFQSNDPDPERIRHRLQAFFLESAIPFVHAWHSIRHAYWTLSYTMACFGDWWRNPIIMSKQTRRQAAEIAKTAEEQQLPQCECRMCRKDRQKGDDAEATEAMARIRKDSSLGEKLVGGLEKRYTLKRSNRGETPIPDWNLPRLATSPTLSVALDGDAVPLTQNRRSYVRQNTNTSQSAISHRDSVRARADSSQEDEVLLPGRSSPGQMSGDTSLMSGALVEHEDTLAEPIAQRSSLLGGNTGYDRLPSR